MTLVELLLALTLFSILLAATSALVRSSLMVQQHWGEGTVPSRQMERALNQLEQDVESAQPFFGVPVSGEATRLELARVSALPGMPPAPEWVRVVYRMDVVDGAPALIRELFRWNEQGGQGEPEQRETLWRIANGQFTFGTLNQQKQLVWATRWDGTQHGVPRLVKFDGTLPAIGPQTPLTLSRIMRSPAGSLPTISEAP